MSLSKQQAKQIRSQIVDLRLKTIYKPNPAVEQKITKLLETLYPITVDMVSRYSIEKETCFITPCKEAFPVEYWNKRKVIEEHCLRCRVCNILLGYSKQHKGLTQDEVAELFSVDYESQSSTGNFYSEKGILWHYHTIEAIKTLEEKIINNLDCWNRGFAHCTVPRKIDASINLSTFRNFVSCSHQELREIRIIEAKTDSVLFKWKMRYFLNASDSQRFIVELVKPCSTIKEAYESMKPNKVKIAERLNNHVLRQGDFFFISTTLEDKDFKHIEKMIVHREIETEYQGYDVPEKEYVVIRRLRPEIELDSRHTATKLAKKGHLTYVKGYVRHPQHSALRLEKWHLVAKNVVKNSISVVSRRAD